MEIDANNKTECKIKINQGSERTFTILDNKKISGTSSCLIPSEQNYFLRIDESCIEKNFTISCDKDFITTLLYKKPGENTYGLLRRFSDKVKKGRVLTLAKKNNYFQNTVCLFYILNI